MNFDTGGRYNPGSDSWAATTTDNAPSGRSAHTAVWTGSEMIVWGGYDGIIYLDTGGRYNPGMDIWGTTSTTDAPAARSAHTAVWTGNEMVVWGGAVAGFIYSNTGGRYCVQTGPTPTPSPTPTPTATPRVTPRPRPTPHVRPTPPL